MGTQRVHLVGLLGWLWRARDCSGPTSLVGLVQNIFSSPYTFSISLSPSPSKLGRQPCWVACLLVCVSGDDRRREGGRRKCGERDKKILYFKNMNGQEEDKGKGKAGKNLQN